MKFYYNHVDGNVNALNSIYMNEVGNRARFKSVPSLRGVGVLSPLDKAPIPPKLKRETLQISGVFVNLYNVWQ